MWSRRLTWNARSTQLYSVTRTAPFCRTGQLSFSAGKSRHRVIKLSPDTNYLLSATRVLARHLLRLYMPVVIGLILFATGSNPILGDTNQPYPTITLENTAVANDSGSPLLNAVNQLSCTASPDHAQQLIDQIAQHRVDSFGLPDEWLGTKDSPALFAATFDFLVHELLTTVTKYPALENPVEQLLLSWNYCQIRSDDYFFNLTTDRSTDGVGRSVAHPDSNSGWSGLQQLGFDIPATYNLTDRNISDRYVPNALTTSAQTRLFRGKRSWELYTEQCFPHPDDGALYIRRMQFGPTRLPGTDLNLGQAQAYPFETNTNCAVFPQSNDGTDHSLLSEVEADKPSGSAPDSPSLESPVVVVLSAKPDQPERPDTQALTDAPELASAIGTNSGLDTNDAVKQPDLASQQEGHKHAKTNQNIENDNEVISANTADSAQIQKTTPSIELSVRNNSTRRNAATNSEQKSAFDRKRQMVAKHIRNSDHYQYRRALAKRLTSTKIRWISSMPSHNKARRKSLQPVLSIPTGDTKLKQRIERFKADQQLLETGKKKRLNKVKSRFIQLSRNSKSTTPSSNKSITNKVRDLKRFEVMTKKRIGSTQQKRVLASRRFASVSKRAIAETETETGENRQSGRAKSQHVPSVDDTPATFASATIVLKANPGNKNAGLPRPVAELALASASTTLLDVTQKKKRLNGTKAARVRASRNLESGNEQESEERFQQSNGFKPTNKDKTNSSATSGIAHASDSRSRIDATGSLKGASVSELADLLPKKRDSVEIQRAKRLSRTKSQRVQASHPLPSGTTGVAHPDNQIADRGLPSPFEEQPEITTNINRRFKLSIAAENGTTPAANPTTAPITTASAFEALSDAPEPGPPSDVESTSNELDNDSDVTPEAKRAQAIQHILNYVENNSPLPDSTTIVLHPDNSIADSGLPSPLDEQQELPVNINRRFKYSVASVNDTTTTSTPTTSDLYLQLETPESSQKSVVELKNNKPDNDSDITSEARRAQAVRRILDYVENNSPLPSGQTIVLSPDNQIADGGLPSPFEEQQEIPLNIHRRFKFAVVAENDTTAVTTNSASSFASRPEATESGQTTIAAIKSNEPDSDSSITPKAKRALAIQRILSYLDNNSPLPAGKTVVLSPDNRTTGSGLPSPLEAQQETPFNTRRQFKLSVAAENDTTIATSTPTLSGALASQPETPELSQQSVVENKNKEPGDDSGNLSDNKRALAMRRILSYIENHSPLPPSTTIVLHPEDQIAANGFSASSGQQKDLPKNENNGFNSQRGESIRNIINHRRNKKPESDKTVLSLTPFGMANVSTIDNAPEVIAEQENPSVVTNHQPTLSGLVNILNYLQNHQHSPAIPALSLNADGSHNRDDTGTLELTDKRIALTPSARDQLNKYRDLLAYIDQQPESLATLLSDSAITLSATGSASLAAKVVQNSTGSLTSAALTQIAAGIESTSRHKFARTNLVGAHLLSRAKMWHVVVSRSRSAIKHDPTWLSAFAYQLSTDLPPAAHIAKRRHALRVFGEDFFTRYASVADKKNDTHNTGNSSNKQPVRSAYLQTELPPYAESVNSTNETELAAASPTIDARTDAPIYVTTPSSNATGLSPVSNVPPHNSSADDGHSHGFSGTIALNNSQLEFGDEDHYSITSAVAWKPVKDSFFFLRSAVTIDSSDDPVNYTWGIGYDDWRPGSWGFEINNWNPLSPGDGLDLENAIVSLTKKFEHELLDERNLSSSLSLNKSANSEFALSWLISWAPRPNWFIRTLITQPLEGGEPSWAYGFGYNNWRKNTFSLEYNNWGFNETFDTNFRQNAIVTLSYKWEW